MAALVDSLLNALLASLNFVVSWTDGLRDRRDDDLSTALVRSRKRRLLQLIGVAFIVAAAAATIATMPAGQGVGAQAIEQVRRWVPFLAAVTLAVLLAAIAYCVYSIRRMAQA